MASSGFLLPADDVPEMPDKMQEALVRYEELFKDRYTLKDRGYRSVQDMDPGLFKVPVLSPWPPMDHRGRRGKFSHRGMRGDYRRRGHPRNWKERWRDDYRSYDNHRSFDDHHSRPYGSRRGNDYYDDPPNSRDYHRGRDPALALPPHSRHHAHPHSSPSPPAGRKSPHRPSSPNPFQHHRHSPGNRQIPLPNFRKRSRSPPRNFNLPTQHHSGYQAEGQNWGSVGVDGDLGDPPQTPSCDPVVMVTSPTLKKDAEVKGEDVFGAKEDPFSIFNMEEMVSLSKKEEVPSTSDVSDILAVAHGPSMGVSLGNPKKSHKDSTERHKLKQSPHKKEHIQKSKKHSQQTTYSDLSSLLGHSKKPHPDGATSFDDHFISASKILADDNDTNPALIDSSNPDTLVPVEPSVGHANFLNSNSFEEFMKPSGKKMKKSKKKRKKALSKEEADFKESKKSLKRKKPMLELLDMMDDDLQLSMGEETEDIDVTTPIGGGAPLSATLKQSLEKDEWSQESQSTIKEMPWDEPSKRKKSKKDRPMDLLVSYDLGSLPQVAAGNTATVRESLSSPESPSPSHLCHSKYEGDSIKVIIQRNDATVKKKKKHKKKKDKTHHDKDAVGHPPLDTAPVDDVDKGEGSLAPLRVRINRFDVNLLN